MTSHTGRSRLWRARVAVLLLAVIPAVLFVFLVSYGQSASAQTPIARAWGINSFGQLGDDSFAPRSKQVEVKGEGGTGTLGNVTSLDGGQNHTLALKSDGTVYAWGYNGTGGLGNGGGPDSNTPVQVSNESGSGFLTGVTDIAAGAEQSLAVASAHNTAWAWGRNEFGSLGNGSFGGNFSRPVQSIQLIGATQIAAGDFHSLAVADADTTAPDTAIDSGPDNPTNSTQGEAHRRFLGGVGRSDCGGWRRLHAQEGRQDHRGHCLIRRGLPERSVQGDPEA